jgi:hypothetical protein
VISSSPYDRPNDGGSNASDTCVSIYQTTHRTIPEDSYLHHLYRENLNSLRHLSCVFRVSSSHRVRFLLKRDFLFCKADRRQLVAFRYFPLQFTCFLVRALPCLTRPIWEHSSYALAGGHLGPGVTLSQISAKGIHKVVPRLWCPACKPTGMRR